jgi:hypothetical protein
MGRAVSVSPRDPCSGFYPQSETFGGLSRAQARAETASWVKRRRSVFMLSFRTLISERPTPADTRFERKRSAGLPALACLLVAMLPTLLTLACQTPRREPRALTASEVRDLARADDFAFAPAVRGEIRGEELSLHIVSPPRCPRGERHDDAQTPRFEFALVRCDEEAGERMLFSVDALYLSVDERTPMDPRARVPVPPSVSNARVPMETVADALAVVVDEKRAQSVLEGERVVLFAEGELVHRDGRTTHNFGRESVRVTGVDGAIASLAARVATTVARPQAERVTLDIRPPQHAIAYVTDVSPALDATAFIALVRKRCDEGRRPILAVVGQGAARGDLLFVTAPSTNVPVCEVVVVSDASETADFLSARASAPAIAVGFPTGAVLVFVHDE